jgi:type VI secretion system protein ImpA
MSIIDIGRLLEAISTESPCGADLAYDQAFTDLSQAARPPRSDGMVVAGTATEGPDWRAVCRQATALFARTKDLRIAVLLIKGLLHTEGLAGLAAGIDCLRQLLDRYWEDVHPRLDIDDDLDPTMRLNILRELCDRDGMLLPIRNVPLVSFPTLGTFGLRQIGLATGEVKLTEGSDEVAPALDVIEGAFRNCKLDDLRATAVAVQASVAHLKAIEIGVTGKVGTLNALRLAELLDVLGQMERLLGARLAARGEGETHETHAESAGGAELRPLTAGQVSSRDDVIRLLDRICEYYERHEPSSPIPVLLRRCKRLVPMQFMDIVRDLVPDGLSQLEVIRGPENTGDA